jgi:hypothetical protein
MRLSHDRHYHPIQSTLERYAEVRKDPVRSSTRGEWFDIMLRGVLSMLCCC